MSIIEEGVAIGACGRACFECRWKRRNMCEGCPAENEAMADDQKCKIAVCAMEKDVENCLQCEEMPCKLRKVLTGAYCPVYGKHAKDFAQFSNALKPK